MSLLELRDIGKIYVSENSVAVGIRGVNAKMDIGEFIAITGASGSGKTTLLNVLSGMDSYEEGEMLICGEPTSHYIQSDWEEYREKYISFIFQDYNILESFTVLQNVELALTHIHSKKERRRRAEQLIDRVGLSKYKHHKGSKLSGGQKQRTVIARALAKDSPIILADEPTGNLDSKSSAEIVELLKEISAEKLVVVVTHSFDELKDVATREIRIFDGAVERDTAIKEAKILPPSTALADLPNKSNKKKLTFVREGFELGIHRFFAKPKLASFMCIIMIVAIIATAFITSNILVNVGDDLKDYIFTPIDGRLVLSKLDGSALSEKEIKALAEKYNAESYLQLDYMLEKYVNAKYPGTKYKTYSLKYKYGTKDCTPSVGSLPQEGEVFLRLPISFRTVYGKDTLLIDTLELDDNCSTFKISGIEYYYDNTKEPELVIRTEDFSKLTAKAFLQNNMDMLSLSVIINYENNGENYNVYQNLSVFVDESLEGNDAYMVNDYILEGVNMTVSDTYFECYGFSVRNEKTATAELNIDMDRSRTMTRKYLTLEEDLDWGIYISSELASKLIEDGIAGTSPQSSLFFENNARAKQVCEDIGRDEYFALTTDEYSFDVETKIMYIIEAALMIFIWFIAIIFLCFFLSLCLTKSVDTLKKDIGILRSMGIKNNAIKVSMYAILALAIIPAFIFFAVAALIVYTTPELNANVNFMHARHYILITLGMCIIVLRLAGTNNKRIFKQSVRKTLRGGNVE